MSLFRPKTTNSSVATKLLGYPVQSSIYGTVIPILYGSTRIAGNVIWYGDWKANPVQSGTTGKGGGAKGSGGGKGGANANQSYTYQAAMMVGLCQGVIAGIGHVWVDQVRMRIGQSNQRINVPAGGGTIIPTWGSSYHGDLGVARWDNWSLVSSDYGSPNYPGTTSTNGNQWTPLKPTASTTPATGQYHVDPVTGAYTFAPGDANKLVSITYRWTQETSSSTGNPIADLNMSVFSGASGQAPWGYLTSNHSDQAFGYSELAYVANPLMDLGSSGVVSNYAFEVQGLLPFGAGIPDCDPAAIVFDFLTNKSYGIGWPLSEVSIAGLTEMSSYCVAHGIFISPALDSQRQASGWIADWLSIANCDAVFSEGILKFRSYGDTSAVGNGVTFTPNLVPIYDLDDDDFIAAAGENTITVARTPLRDAENQIPVEWMNRGNDYNAETLHAENFWHINQFGVKARAMTQFHAITTQAVAAQVANTLVKRSVYIRLTVTFKVTQNYALLECMDLVTVTDPYLGWIKQPVRILSIDEDDKFELTITAEEFPWGTAKPALYQKQVSSSFGPGYFSTPGDVHAPVFFEATPEMSQEVQYELMIGLSGGDNWGGCTVWMSTDGISYTSIGTQTGQATVGALTALLPGSGDPDNTDSLMVDMSGSGSALQAWSAAQKDAFVSLALVGTELVSYQGMTLTGSGQYTLNLLRRGIYRTPAGPHPAGSPFLFFDGAEFIWKYKTIDVGRMHWFKFTSFNESGAAQQDIATAAVYKYYINGPRLPYPLHSGDTTSPVGDVYYSGSSFGLRPAYIRLKTGQLARLLFSFQPAKTVASTATTPPSFTVAMATTGGTIPGGIQLVVGMTAVDAYGTESAMSPLQVITAGTGTSTNKLTVSGISFHTPVSDRGKIYIGYQTDAQGLWLKTSVDVGATSGVVTDASFQGDQPPDPMADHYMLRAQLELHGGIYGGQINSLIGFKQMTFLTSNWTVNSLAGRFVSLVAKYDNASPSPMWDAVIVSNTADTLTLDTDPSTTGIGVGDVMIIRSQATIATATTIGDALYVNGGSGQAGTGLKPFSEKGAIWIIRGPGAGQIRPIVPDTNTATTYTVASAWDVMPTSASTFILVENVWNYSSETHPTTQKGSGSVSFPLDIVNAARTYFVQVVTVSSTGLKSDIRYSPFREVYIFGNGINRRKVTADYVLDINDQDIDCDATSGPITITLMPRSVVAGEEFTITKVATDTSVNAVTVVVATETSGQPGTINYVQNLVIGTAGESYILTADQ